MTDPIADMLTRIRNGVKAQKESVVMPYSKQKEGIAKLLKENHFIQFYDVQGAGVKKVITVLLRYTTEGESVIRSLQRQSRPGCRVFKGYEELKPVRNGFGIAILSTPKGILSDDQARAQKLGGEVLLTIW